MSDNNFTAIWKSLDNISCIFKSLHSPEMNSFFYFTL